jgi:integrase
VIGWYMNWMRARRLSPGTLRTAHGIIARFADWLLERSEGRHLWEAEPDDLRDWQESRGRLAASTLRTNVVALRTFYRWLADEDLLERDPMARSQAPRAPKTLPRPIPEDRLDAALAAADRRLQAVLALAAFAGLRACEIASLTWGDVDLDGGRPHVRVVGKGSKHGVVDLSPELVRILQRLPNAGSRRGPVIRRADGGPGHYTANALSKLANDYLHDQGIPDTLHSLRHRFITEITRVAGLRRAQEAARHASPSTTAGYAAVVREELRPFVEAVGRVLSPEEQTMRLTGRVDGVDAVVEEMRAELQQLRDRLAELEDRPA